MPSKRELETLIVAPLSIFSLWLGAFVQMWLWNNLITPTFDLMTLSIGQAFGLQIFVTYLTAGRIKPSETDPLEQVLGVIITTLSIWGLGWFASLFI